MLLLLLLLLLLLFFKSIFRRFLFFAGDKSSVALTDFVSYVTTDDRKGRGSGQNTSNECLFVLDEELKKSDTSRNGERYHYITIYLLVGK